MSKISQVVKFLICFIQTSMYDDKLNKHTILIYQYEKAITTTKTMKIQTWLQLPVSMIYWKIINVDISLWGKTMQNW